MASILLRLLPFKVPRLWGRRRQDTDYEVILAKLSADIDKIQTRLAQVRARQRRAAITFTAYALGIWALYTLACYALGELRWEPIQPDDLAADASSLWSARTLFVWMPILLSPILILSTRRIVGWWYTRIASAEEAHLQDLRKRQRDKIAEIKRATDFDHLLMLLDKYDEDRPRGAGGAQQLQQQHRAGPRQSMPAVGGNPAAAAGGAQGSAQQAGRQQGRGAPRHSMPAQLLQPQLNSLNQGRDSSGGAAGTSSVDSAPRQGVPAAAQSVPLPPAQRTVMDKFADWMFGPDPSLGVGTGVSAAMQKYALICSRCLNHNGLAMPHEFDEIQYICPKCGAFNSRRPSSVPVSTPSFFSRPASAAGGGAATSPSAGATSSQAGSSSPLARSPALGSVAGGKTATSSRPSAVAEEEHATEDQDDDAGAVSDANESSSAQAPQGKAGKDDDDDEEADEEGNDANGQKNGKTSSTRSSSGGRAKRRTGLRQRKGGAQDASEPMEVD